MKQNSKCPVSGFSTPLLLAPHFSKCFAGMVVLLHSGACMVLIPLRFPPVVETLTLKLSVGALIVANAVYIWRYHVQQQGCPFTYCQLHHDEILLFPTEVKVRLSPDSFVHPQLVILRVQLPNQQISTLIIFPDALDKTTFRRLRVYLKHHAKENMRLIS